MQLDYNKLSARVGYCEGDIGEIAAELVLKIGRDENNQIISMINAAANIITLNSNRLVINSDYFKLSKDGTITASALTMNGGTVDLKMNGGSRVLMGKTYDDFGIASAEYDGEYGERLGLRTNGIVYENNGLGQMPIVFSSASHLLTGEWYINNLGSSAAVTSDRAKKNYIEPQPEVYSKIFDKLNPVTFKYNNGTSDRTHTGFIAQDIEEAVISEGLTTKEFAAVCFDTDEQGNKINYGVRYEEIVSLCVHEIQALKKKISKL